MLYRYVYIWVYVHVSVQMWVDCKAWQDCTERDHHGGRLRPLFLLPYPSKGQEVGDMESTGLLVWENNSFVQGSQEMEPDPAGISPRSGNITPSLGRCVGGGAVGSLASLLSQTQQTAALATPQG